MYKKIQYYYCAFCLLFVLSSCGDDDKAIIPAYLTINDISIKTSTNQGTSDDNVIDAKVFINDESIGTFELPASIPIQQTGNVNLKIRGGIFRNGQSNDRDDYPFYTTYEVDTFFTPESEMIINPEVTYFSSAKINEAWAGEDFEGGINFDYDDNSDTTFIRVNNSPEVFEGASGLAHLVAGQTFFEARSPNIVDVSRNGKESFVEFNYKSTHDIVVSIYANGQTFQTSLVFLRARASYTKIYIPLTDVFSTLSTAINYNFAIGYQKPIEDEGKLYVDNFKMVSF